MKTMLNTRIPVLIALGIAGAGGFFAAHAIPQAQAEPVAAAATLPLSAKMDAMQKQITELQAQVKKLQADSHRGMAFSAPSGSVPILPKQSDPSSSPQVYSNIPPCKVTLLHQSQ